MGDYAFPFPAIDDDRMYGAADWAAYFAQFISNGVFPVGAQLQVTAGSGMQVNASAGAAWINGYGRVFDTAYVLDIDPADGVLNRIDRVVVRWGRVERNMYLDLLKGTAASNPTAPALVRDADYYDLCLAEISVNAGITAIAAAHISDKRLIPELCGIVSSVITPDTAGWYEGWEAEYLNWLTGKRADFDEWFDALEILLSGDVAANLAAGILTKADRTTVEEIEESVDALVSSDEMLTTSGTTPDFTVTDASVTAYFDGLIRTVQFHADGEEITVKFNGLGVLDVFDYTNKPTKVKEGQILKLRCNGTSFFVCSGGGGVSLPQTIEAGDTIKLLTVTNVVSTSSTTFINMPSPYGFTVNKAGTYRIFFVVNNAAYATTTQGQLTKNGVVITESTISTGRFTARKTIDLELSAGDVVRMQARTNSKSDDTYMVQVSPFIVSILAEDLQGEVSGIITPI